MGGFRSVRPIADELRKEHQITVVAEGISLEEWRSAGYAPSQETESLPNVDIAVITAGHPIFLEAKVAEALRGVGVPQVWVEDFWGNSARLPGVGPELLITLDACGTALARQDHRFAASKILEVGNLAVNQFEVPTDVEDLVAGLREEFGKLVLFLGQGWDTVDMLGVLFSSLTDVKERYALIPRWHPKRLPEGGHAILWPKMMDIFATSAYGTKILDLNSVKSTDALASCCDIVISGSSTGLLYAAKAGKVAVSISTPVTRASLGAQVAFDRWPGIEAGLGILLSEPVSDLFSYIEEEAPSLKEPRRKYFSAPVLKPAEVAAEILQILH